MYFIASASWAPLDRRDWSRERQFTRPRSGRHTLPSGPDVKVEAERSKEAQYCRRGQNYYHNGYSDANYPFYFIFLLLLREINKLAPHVVHCVGIMGTTCQAGHHHVSTAHTAVEYPTYPPFRSRYESRSCTVQRSPVLPPRPGLLSQQL